MELALVDCGLAAVDCRRLRHDLSGFGFDFFSFLITHPFSCVGVVICLSTAGGKGGVGSLGVAMSETRNADEREMGDGVPTQSSVAGGASEWSFL
ncbi:hypothetical protein Tco_0021012 [Tanacetum coccineum]